MRTSTAAKSTPETKSETDMRLNEDGGASRDHVGFVAGFAAGALVGLVTGIVVAHKVLLSSPL